MRNLQRQDISDIILVTLCPVATRDWYLFPVADQISFFSSVSWIIIRPVDDMEEFLKKEFITHGPHWHLYYYMHFSRGLFHSENEILHLANLTPMPHKQHAHILYFICCFVVVFGGGWFYPYPSGVLHWDRVRHTITPCCQWSSSEA